MLRKNFHLKLVLIAILAIVATYMNIGSETKVYAASISNPMPINQIFPDRSLAEIMKWSLKKGSETDLVSQQDLDQVENIYANRRNIQSIKGVQYLQNLKSLYLNNNQPKDISEIASLTKLETLYLENNQLTDISAIASLSNLSKLSLSNNQIKDIRGLSNLNKLETVYLNSNQLTDISGLASLSNVTTLDLNNNEIKDIRALSTLVKLKKLYLNNNQLTNINHLAGLLKLKVLSFNENQVVDVSSLAKLTNLTGLYFNRNQVANISSLANLINLTSLEFSQNHITDISILEKLSNLEFLDFDKNKVSDISKLVELSHLTYLFFYDNQVTNIDTLAKLPNLVGVGFNGNKVNNIKELANVTNLKYLHAEGNCIQDIKALKSLTQLEVLRLARNHIVDISPLKGLKNLQELDLSNQTFINQPINFQGNVTIPNIVKGMTGTWVAPNSSSDKVTYNPPKLTWNLPTYKKEVCYTFNQTVTIGNATFKFSGQVTQPFNKLDIVKSNKTITAYGRVKPGMKSTVWTQPSNTKDAKQVGMVSAYAGKNLRILREAQTSSGSYYQFSVGGKPIGWVETKALGIFYQTSMEKKATGARYIVRGKEGQHAYTLPVAEAAVNKGPLTKWKGKRLIVQREVTVGKEKWLLLQGVGWVKATNVTTVLYNKPMTAYAKVKLAKGKKVWSNPYNTSGYKVVGALSRFTGKDLRILREAQTGNGLYYQVRVGNKTIGWVEAKNVAVFYNPRMEKKEKGTRFVNARKKKQAYYRMPVADAAICCGKLQKFGRKRVTIDRKATIKGQQWYRIKGAGWTRAVNLSTRR
ncbi:GW domain-containing glycosaminoglycan-binding protein [Listeria ivanovii]|uniref:GW domain-containing glycosaminoglycan-binding protein n=2 Tax=Listeria ivanovii TaxID=1638 RepID=UPI00068A8687|nr:GW domain-containing glycosaminoglycan-binding protein [Listeria ivanovii]